jgi:hypothetical protein
MTRSVSYPDHVDEAKMLDLLIAKGVTHATFHEDGSLASVSFAPEHEALTGTPQHEPSTVAAPRARTTPRLVPRVPSIE